MGIGEADISGNGYPDYVITSQGDNKVQALKAGPAQPSYRDIAKRLGVTAAQPSSGGRRCRRPRGIPRSST